ncbi:hypothetical protein SGM_0945 [Streptomyces griseoaurantiacus M045]|uniref:Uncharacterized protein n=1 Tax=Streptomyces griseoaurantiacus M045 TaxID=996637 RepID=F3NCT1_9ACTN|nr:hypothetical protein SGM_0945 [Streptomyces griseoaurantiacus M045]
MAPLHLLPKRGSPQIRRLLRRCAVRSCGVSGTNRARADESGSTPPVPGPGPGP